MSGAPVVIATNGYGMAVRPVDSGAPVLTVAENGFGMPIVISDLGAPFVVEGLEFNPASLFLAEDQGAWFYPSATETLFQTVSGNTSASAIADPVGLALDKSKGLVLGPELTGSPSFDDAAQWSAGSTIVVSEGVATYAAIPSGNSVQVLTPNRPTVVAGEYIEATLVVDSVSAGGFAIVFASTTGPTVNAPGTYVFRIAATASGVAPLGVRSSGTTTGVISYFSAKRLPGQHATQGTAASRPTLQQTGSRWYLNDDLTDDALNWSAPAGDYTIAYVSAGNVVTILEAQALSGATDIMASQMIGGYFAIDRLLTTQEKSSLSAFLMKDGTF